MIFDSFYGISFIIPPNFIRAISDEEILIFYIVELKEELRLSLSIENRYESKFVDFSKYKSWFEVILLIKICFEIWEFMRITFDLTIEFIKELLTIS